MAGKTKAPLWPSARTINELIERDGCCDDPDCGWPEIRVCDARAGGFAERAACLRTFRADEHPDWRDDKGWVCGPCRGEPTLAPPIGIDNPAELPGGDHG